MKKYIPLVLTLLNITIIVLLLFFSASILYFNANTNKAIMGRSAVLYQDTLSEGCNTALLIINKKDSIQKGDRVFFYEMNTQNEKLPFVDIVSDITDSNLLLHKGDKTIPINSPLIQGVVQSKSYFWGKFFAPLTTQTGFTTAIICIIAGFAILALSIVLIYLWKRKKIGSLYDAEDSIPNDIEIDETPEAPKQKAITVVEETEQPDAAQSLIASRTATQPSPSRTPLIAARYENDHRGRPINIGYSERANALNEESKPADVHDFNTVEELFVYYHTGEIELEKQTQQPSAIIPQKDNTNVEKPPVVETKDDTRSIDSLLDEIMKQAEQDYITEHKDSAIQKYLL